MPGRVQSVERAAAILRLLATGEGRSLGDLSGALGLSKSTVHGIVRTLVDVGFAEQDPVSGAYLLAPGILGRRPKAMDINEMRSRATNWVDALAGRTRLSARLVVLPAASPATIHTGVTAHHVFSASAAPQRVEIGDPVDLAATAEGRVLLALNPTGGQVLDCLLDGEPDDSSARQLRDNVSATRSRSLAVALGRRSAGAAVPVRSHGGMVVAALGVRGTVDQVLTPARAPRPDVLSALVEAARGTSHALMAKRW